MKKGEIWLVDFNPTSGQEISKIRPAIIISSNDLGKLNLKVVVPVTNSIRMVEEWHVILTPSRINGLSKESVADCFQLKNISTSRFIKKLGNLSDHELDEVKLAIMKVLELY
jgi:mRNA interferase MazF